MKTYSNKLDAVFERHQLFYLLAVPTLLILIAINFLINGKQANKYNYDLPGDKIFDETLDQRNMRDG